MKSKLITTLTLIAFATCTIAAPRGNGKGNHKGKNGHRHGKHNQENVAERAAIKEEARLDHVDTHKWKKDPTARDHRPDNIRDYATHTQQRIVKLLTLGALEEADGTTFKTRQTAIVTDAKKASADGLNEAEKKNIRASLNGLNDDINKSIQDAEQGDARTPMVNRSQHKIEEQIEFGIRSGRLSTLEASSLKRKVAKLEKLEERLKKGDSLSTSERERLMEEVIEIKRDLHKDMRD